METGVGWGRLSLGKQERENITERIEWGEERTNFFTGGPSKLFLGTWTDQSERGPNWWLESERREAELHSMV